MDDWLERRRARLESAKRRLKLAPSAAPWQRKLGQGAHVARTCARGDCTCQQLASLVQKLIQRRRREPNRRLLLGAWRTRRRISGFVPVPSHARSGRDCGFGGSQHGARQVVPILVYQRRQRVGLALSGPPTAWITKPAA